MKGLVPFLQVFAFCAASYRAYRGGPLLFAKYITEDLQAGPYLAVGLCVGPFLLLSWGTLNLAIGVGDRVGDKAEKTGTILGLVGAAAIGSQQIAAFGMSSTHPSFTHWGVAAGLVGSLIGWGALSLAERGRGKTGAGNNVLLAGTAAIVIVEAVAFWVNRSSMNITGDYPWFAFWGTFVGILGATGYLYFALRALRALQALREAGREPSVS